MKVNAVVTLSTISASTINGRSLQVIEYLKQHHCTVKAIEETKVIRSGEGFYRFKVKFEDGLGSIGYSSLPEILEEMKNLQFISIEVVDKK